MIKTKVFKTQHCPAHWSGSSPQGRVDIHFSRGKLTLYLGGNVFHSKDLGVDTSALETKEMMIWLGDTLVFTK